MTVLVPQSRHVYIDLVGFSHGSQDCEDPVYPYTPPSPKELIDQLSEAPAHSFNVVTLSVPWEPRSTSAIKTVEALASFLSSPACAALDTLRIAGSLHLLNDKGIQNALKQLPLRCLDLQEPRAMADSYALAATLSALDGIAKLYLACDAEHSRGMHKSFREETKGTFSKLKSLHLLLRGNCDEILSSVFGSGNLPGLEAIDSCFEGSRWATSTTRILSDATSSFSSLRTVKITRSASDARSSSTCDGRGLLPLLAAPTLEKICVASQRPSEAIHLPMEVFKSLPSGLKMLELTYAGPPHVVDLYIHLQNSLSSLEQLQLLRLDHSYPEEEEEEGGGAWQVVRLTVGHPATARHSASAVLARLADALETVNVTYRLRLTGEKHHEERAGTSK